MTTTTDITVRLRRPHEEQRRFIEALAKRIMIRAGRRSGKTVGIAIRAVRRFLDGRRVLYAAPTQEQVDAFWFECKRALGPMIDRGILTKNESTHVIERPGTKQRIRAKTAWNADTLRGDYADDLILDEWQLMDEEAWEQVGAPMLADNDGDAVFIYTPPSLRSRSASKARDPLHAAKMFLKAKQDTSGRWATFAFPSQSNPYISQVALSELTQDMTALAYRQEILAEDVDETPGALWKRGTIEMTRRTTLPANMSLARIIIGVDPSGGVNEIGIIVGALGADQHGYVIADYTLRGSPDGWGGAVVKAYIDHKADRIVAEDNFGGQMVEATVKAAASARNCMVSYKSVSASRGKAVRAEPIAARYEQGLIHHIGTFARLEDELCNWIPGVSKESPNRMDALVWAMTELMGHGAAKIWV